MEKIAGVRKIDREVVVAVAVVGGCAGSENGGKVLEVSGSVIETDCRSDDGGIVHVGFLGPGLNSYSCCGFGCMIYRSSDG